ncbi:MAG: DUF6252 family protein [Chitinophagaceae bacterium]
MKFKMIVLLGIYTVIMATSCSNSAQGEATSQANAIQEAVDNSSGAITTNENGNYIKAKIDGRNWSAAKVTPDYSVGSNYLRIAGDNKGDGLSFTIWKPGVRIGKAIPFSDNHAADLTLNEVSGFLSGLTGEVVVTAYDDQWVEGTFYFTATGSSTDRKIQVTDGHFRISLVADAK